MGHVAGKGAVFAPELVLKEVAPALAFYKKAFGVEELLIIKNEDGWA